MAKPASSVVAIAGGFLLQGLALAQPTCVNITGTWYEHRNNLYGHAPDPIENHPIKIVQDGCSFNWTWRTQKESGSVDNSTVNLFNSNGLVASDGKEMSCPYCWQPHTWQRDCPGGLEGNYSSAAWNRSYGQPAFDQNYGQLGVLQQDRCNLNFTLGTQKFTGFIGEDLRIFERIEMVPYMKEVGLLVSKISLTWNGLLFEKFHPVPCSEHDAFVPTDYVEGHCEGFGIIHDPSLKERCLSSGCHWEGEHGYYHCHCSSQQSCEAHGDHWEGGQECSEAMSRFSSFHGLTFSSVHYWTWLPELGGSVSGVYDRCSWNEEFRHSIAHMSKACCSIATHQFNRDKSVCDVLYEDKPTFCFRPEDFEPRALVDGSRTCADTASWLGPLPGLYVYKTTEYGKITGAMDKCKEDEAFAGWTHHLSNTCCRGRESICDIEGQPKPTPCFEPADFKPEAILNGHCIGDETSDPARESWCRGMGCHWDESDESEDRCHCHEKDLCERNNFTWEDRTCADTASWLGPLPGLYVYRTTGYGKITGAMDKCKKDDGFSGMVTWMKETCCGGKPSICDVGGSPKCIEVPLQSVRNFVANGTLAYCKPEQ